MAWDSTPPTKEELEKANSWADTPPTQEELSALSMQPNPEASQSQIGALLRGAMSNIPGHPVERINALAGSLGGQGNYSDLLPQYMAKEAAENAAAQQSFPKTSTAGRVAGAAGLASALPGAGSVPGLMAQQGLLGAAQSISNAPSSQDTSQTAINALKQGGTNAALAGVAGAGGNLIGAASNVSNPLIRAGMQGTIGAGTGAALGATNAALTGGNIGEEATTGAEYGAGAGLALSPLQALSSALTKSELAATADQLAEKSVNIPEETLKRQKAIQATAEEQGKELPTIGETLRTEDIPLTASKRMIVQKLQDSIDNSEKTLQGYLKQVAPEAANSDIPSITEKAQEVADKAASQIEHADGPEKAEAFKEEATKYIDYLASKENDIVTLNNIKRAKYNNMSPSDWNQMSPVRKQYQKDLAGVIKGRIEELANDANPGIGDKIAQINRQQGNAIEARDSILDTAAPASITPADLGLGSLGTAAAMTHNPLLGIASAGGAVLKKGVEMGTGRSLGSIAKGAASKGMRTMSEMAPASAMNVTPSGATIAGGMNSSTTEGSPKNEVSNAYTSDELMQYAQRAQGQYPKLSVMLQRAAQGNDMERSQMLYNMGTSPAYRPQLEQLGMKTNYNKGGASGR